MHKLLKFLKFKYLILFSLLCLFINFKFLFLFIFLIFLKIYLKFKKIIFLLISYFFLSLLILDAVIPKFKNDESIYHIDSNIDYTINANYGYHPKRNKIFEEKFYKNQNLFKKITYTVNNYGHRISPDLDNVNDCLLFHGGSIVFGQSVNDNETLPYRISEKLNDNFLVFNFAFNGYGPHQFLAKIENNYLEELNKCNNLLVIYFYIQDHIGRVAGKRSWGDKSPRYIYDQNKLINKGFFSDYPFKLIMKKRKNIRNSFSISKIINIDSVDLNDEKLFIKLIDDIEQKINPKFNQVNFLYIIWQHEKNLNNATYQKLKQKNNLEINFLNIPEKFKRNGIPGDNHPTKEFYEILSKEVVKYINNF